MSIKKEELETGCFAKAADDEPLFVLRAQDYLAPKVVRLWASMLALENSVPHAVPVEQVDFYRAIHERRQQKIMAALELADQMERWPNRKVPD